MIDYSEIFIGSEADRVKVLVELLTVPEVAHDVFRGPRMPDGVGRIYGGQVIAQALAAAQQTVDDDRSPHSLHAYFLRGGDENYPIDLRVARDFDGRSFSNRRVIASQNGVPILNLASSFQRPGDVASHQDPMPGIAMPEDLPDELDISPIISKAREDPRQSGMLLHRPYEVRIPGDLMEPGRDPAKPVYYWFRMLSALPDDAALHRLAIAYLSDYGLLFTAAIRHNLKIFSPKARVASLDHAIWFHQAARADEWLAYVLDSDWAGNSRGFTRGRFYTRDGRLVASTAQEGMIREA